MAHNEKRGREMRLKAKRTAKAERKRIRREAGAGLGGQVVDASHFFPPDVGGAAPPAATGPSRPASDGR